MQTTADAINTFRLISGLKINRIDIIVVDGDEVKQRIDNTVRRHAVMRNKLKTKCRRIISSIEDERRHSNSTSSFCYQSKSIGKNVVGIFHNFPNE